MDVDCRGFIEELNRQREQIARPDGECGSGDRLHDACCHECAEDKQAT
jgi:hypothetical protein